MAVESLRILLLSLIVVSACKESRTSKFSAEQNEIVCSKLLCKGSYRGPEFINGEDVAHQFSNTMSAKVGDNLNALYDEREFSKVDFPNIQMSTNGMGTGEVNYSLKIPFVKVATRCDAYTSFDHVGGWNHTPELEKRKQQLGSALLPGDRLDISNLKMTKEGLQEYWIQWRNKSVQQDCI